MTQAEILVLVVLVGAAVAVALAWQLVMATPRTPIPDVWRKGLSDAAI